MEYTAQHSPRLTANNDIKEPRACSTRTQNARLGRTAARVECESSRIWARSQDFAHSLPHDTPLLCRCRRFFGFTYPGFLVSLGWLDVAGLTSFGERTHLHERPGTWRLVVPLLNPLTDACLVFLLRAWTYVNVFDVFGRLLPTANPFCLVLDPTGNPCEDCEVSANANILAWPESV